MVVRTLYAMHQFFNRCHHKLTPTLQMNGMGYSELFFDNKTVAGSVKTDYTFCMTSIQKETGNKTLNKQ